MDRDSYAEGYNDGFAAGMRSAPNQPILTRSFKPVKVPRKQSGKQKILTAMAKKAWDKYKKGSGKKSYIDIRAQVSKSAKYKKETKGM